MGIVIKRVFCLDLPTAGLVVGILGIFGGIWETVKTLLHVAYFDENFSGQDKRLKTASFKEYFPGHDERLKTTAYVTLLFLLIVCIFEILISILLVLGTRKKSPRMLLPWLILKGIILAILIPVVSVHMVCELYFVVHGHSLKNLIQPFILILTAVVCSYTYLIVYSLYHFIRNELENKPQRIDPESLNYKDPNIQYYANS